MINDTLKATGELEITLRDTNGNVKVHKIVPNLVVTVGKELIASRLASNTDSVVTHMAVGSDNTNLVAANTDLAATLGARIALTSTTVNANVVTYEATFQAGEGTGGVVEAGLFNALTGPTMLCRTTFGLITKEASDLLTISWSVTIN